MMDGKNSYMTSKKYKILFLLLYIRICSCVSFVQSTCRENRWLPCEYIFGAFVLNIYGRGLHTIIMVICIFLCTSVQSCVFQILKYPLGIMSSKDFYCKCENISLHISLYSSHLRFAHLFHSRTSSSCDFS